MYFPREEGVFVFGGKYPGNAANAGLGSQDILLSVDGTDIKTIDDVKKVHERLVADVENKSRVLVKVMRSGQSRQMVLDFRRDFEKE